jgi:RNA polymerase sigma-B factor
LIKAVDRFDTGRDVAFASYAIPTILGELKRHFRDIGGSVRVPRRLQELKPRLATVTEDLTQQLHRAPTTAEVATRLGVTGHEVRLARLAATAYRPVSVQQPVTGYDDLYLIDLLAVADRGIEAIDNRETLRVLLAALPAREQLVLGLRFFGDLTQTQIAARIGVSQMHVSRLLARSLTRLHEAILADPGPTGATAATTARPTATASTRRPPAPADQIVPPEG